jgi:hypothetical protein
MAWSDAAREAAAEARRANATDKGKALAARVGLHADAIAKRALRNRQIDGRDARGYRGGQSHPSMPSLADQLRFHNDAAAKRFGFASGGIHAMPRSLGDSVGAPLHADFGAVKAATQPSTGTFIDKRRVGSKYNSGKYT